MNEGMKRCTKCKELKPNTAGYFKWSNERGTTQPCRDCHRTANAQYAKNRRRENPEDMRRKNREWKHAHSDALNERRRELYAGNPDPHRMRIRIYNANHKEERKQYNKQWHAKHPGYSREVYRRDIEKSREYGRKKHRENREREYRYTKEWKAANRERTRAHGHKRRAVERNLPANWSGDTWIKCLEYWGCHCVYCGNQEGLFPATKLTADHWIPVSDPRPDNPGTVPENMLPVCFSCNCSKRNNNPHSWLISRYGPDKAHEILTRIEQYFAWVKVEEGAA